MDPVKMRERYGSVLVLILTNFESRPCDPNVGNLERLFSDPYFIVKKVNVQNISPKPKSNPLTDRQWEENYRVRKALEYAARGPRYLGPIAKKRRDLREWGDLPVLVVKDSSISILSPQSIKTHIESTLFFAPGSDLHFLTVWGDSCSNYQPVIRPGSDPKLVWTTKPNSTQAVIYSPSARDYIRSKLIDSAIPLGEIFNSWLTTEGVSSHVNKEGKCIRATACVPNIINFDISLATSSSDYYKLNQCGTNTGKQQGSAISKFIWFLIIVSLIIFVAYCLIVLGPKSPVE